MIGWLRAGRCQTAGVDAVLAQIIAKENGRIRRAERLNRLLVLLAPLADAAPIPLLIPFDRTTMGQD